MGGKGGLSGMGGAGYAVALPSTPAPSKHLGTQGSGRGYDCTGLQAWRRVAGVRLEERERPHVVQCSISGPAQVAHCGWQWWHIS